LRFANKHRLRQGAESPPWRSGCVIVPHFVRPPPPAGAGRRQGQLHLLAVGLTDTQAHRVVAGEVPQAGHQRRHAGAGRCLVLRLLQCDASDRRSIRLPNGDVLETTCLVVSEFDLLAVNLFALENKWRFAFARNEDLPHATYRGYIEEQRQYLLATLMTVTWPLQPPFGAEPFRLLENIVRGRSR